MSDGLNRELMQAIKLSPFMSKKCGHTDVGFNTQLVSRLVC